MHMSRECIASGHIVFHTLDYGSIKFIPELFNNSFVKRCRIEDAKNGNWKTWNNY